MASDRIIIQKISEVVASLGGKSDILSVISSWKDSLDNDQVLQELNSWLEAETEDSRNRLHPA